jgi:phosphotransferase system enzyme I (PtsI)
MEYNGVGVSKGKSIGKAVIIHDVQIKKNNIEITDSSSELEKVTTSFASLTNEYNEIIKKGNKESKIVSLVETYKLIVSSPSLLAKVKKNIINNNYTAAAAVDEALSDREKKASLLSSDYAKGRSLDMRSIKDRIVKKIFGIEEVDLSHIDYDFIIVSKEVTPSMLLSASPKYIKGVISEIGSTTSHVAILSKNLGIPAVFGISNIATLIQDDEFLYLNGNNGTIINKINNDLLSKYIAEVNIYYEFNKMLNDMISKPTQTKDGKNFEVASNIGDMNDLDRVIKVNPDGVGLFRSEFLYLNRDIQPTEDLQFNVYKSFAVSLKAKPLIIRTIDIGGDKKTPFFDITNESNPFLGYRAIRYCLDHKDLFKTQLRALLKASYYGNVMIMFPMISSMEELQHAKAILNEAKKELDQEKTPYNKHIKVGIMVEVPSVAVMIDMFIEEVDFCSIGANDLVQYTLAVDRTNASVSKLYDAFNPSVIRLIKNTIDSKKGDKFVGMCGEMAADPLYIIILVGLGLNGFSVNVNSVLKVKKYISLLNYESCKKVVEHILTIKTGEKIKKYLENYAKDVFNIYMNL